MKECKRRYCRTWVKRVKEGAKFCSPDCARKYTYRKRKIKLKSIELQNKKISTTLVETLKLEGFTLSEIANIFKTNYWMVYYFTEKGQEKYKTYKTVNYQSPEYKKYSRHRYHLTTDKKFPDCELCNKLNN